MKLLLTILLGMLCLVGSAQDRRDYSPYGLTNAELSFSMSQLSPHRRATQITYFDLNFSNLLIQLFMQEKMGMALVDSKFSNNGNTITMTWLQQATMGTNKIPKLIFKYELFTNKYKNPIIKSLNISGSSNKVIDFFVSYWPTQTNFNEHSYKIAYNYLLQDKATIRLTKNGSWIIDVVNNTIHNTEQYYASLNSAISEQHKKQYVQDSISKSHVTIIQNPITTHKINGWEKSNTPTPIAIKSNANTDSLILAIKKSIIPDNKTIIMEDIVFEIQDGVISNVITEKGTSIPKSIKDSIDHIAIGYKVGSGNYTNKKYYVQYIPGSMREIRFSERR